MNNLTGPSNIDYRHIWLYAKKHYHTTHNVMYDLKIIFAHRAGTDPQYISAVFIVDTLIRIILDNVKNIDKLNSWILEMIKPFICLPSLYLTAKERLILDKCDSEKMLFFLHRCLSQLEITRVRSDAGTIISLGEKDPELEKLLKARR